MNASLRHEIHDQLRRVVLGQTSIAQFHHWFSPILLDADTHVDPEMEPLVETLGAILAEFSAGQWSEAEVRVQLRDQIAEAGVSASSLRSSD